MSHDIFTHSGERFVLFLSQSTNQITAKYPTGTYIFTSREDSIGQVSQGEVTSFRYSHKWRHFLEFTACVCSCSTCDKHTINVVVSPKNRSGQKPSQQFLAISLQICNGAFTSRSSAVLAKMWIWTEIVTIAGDMMSKWLTVSSQLSSITVFQAYILNFDTKEKMQFWNIYGHHSLVASFRL